MAVGFGFDLHRLRKGAPLVLGGVKVPSRHGAVGHSNGDVVLHALVDALLGATGRGDIGDEFPDDDPRNRGRDSREFVRAVWRKIAPRVRLENLDICIMLERPKLGIHKVRIRESIAQLLGVRPSRVNIKAKTLEGLGPIGQGKAVSAQAFVELRPRRR